MYEFAKDLTERQRATYSERLLRLRELMLALPKKDYDHRQYVHECGTPSCALGWAAGNPQTFPGLDLRIGGRAINGALEFCLLRKNGDTCHEDAAADEYFGEGAHSAVFDYYAYALADTRRVKPERVAKRIAAFVKQRYGYEPVTP